ncbi:MAG: Hsp20/alpha crystallin family protein [bacterium]
MAKGKKEKGEAPVFDFGISGLFNGIEKLVDLAGKLEAAGGEIKKEGEIDLSHLREGMKGVFGFSVKTATGGKTVVEPFGNIKKTPKGPIVEEVREPMSDVFDEKEEVLIIVEMPGVHEEGVTVDLKEDILEISGAGKNRKYRKEILLPKNIKKETLSHHYKNGILEVKVKKCH